MLNDKAISFKARGLLSFMLSMPNEWRFYRSEIKKHSNQDGGTAIGNAIKELIQAGYLTCKQLKDEQGKWQESEWEVRETPNKIPQQGKPSAGKPSAGNKPLLNTNRVNTNSKKGILKKIKNSISFDPEELPGRFIKYPEVIKAWLEFIHHRKKLGHQITERAHKKLIKKILPQPPEAIISAIDTAIENDWRGLFFNDYSINTKGRVRGRPDTDTTLNAGTKLGIDGQLLYNFIVGVLGNSLVSKPKINCLLKDMTDFHTGKIPEGALEHLGWGKFFKDWLLFLEEKESSFPLQSVNQLKIDGLRWNEYIKRCEHWTSYSFKTGKWIGG